MVAGIVSVSCWPWELIWNWVLWLLQENGTASFCLCREGWTGARCDRQISTCSDTKCNNGGTCVEDLDRVGCLCPPGYGGTTCEQPLEPHHQKCPCLVGKLMWLNFALLLMLAHSLIHPSSLHSFLPSFRCLKNKSKQTQLPDKDYTSSGNNIALTSY